MMHDLVLITLNWLFKNLGRYTYIPWNKIREPVPQGVQVPMCFCGSLCKLKESKVLGDDFGRRFFICENYEYDPPKSYGKDKAKVSPRTL